MVLAELPDNVTDLTFSICFTGTPSIAHLSHQAALVSSGAADNAFFKQSPIGEEPPPQNSANTHVNPATAITNAPMLTATSLPALPIALGWAVLFSGLRAASTGPGDVVVPEMPPLGFAVFASVSFCCSLVTTLSETEWGKENPRVSVTSEVYTVGRGVLGGAMMVGVVRVAWLVPSVAMVGFSSGTGIGVPRVA